MSLTVSLFLESVSYREIIKGCVCVCVCNCYNDLITKALSIKASTEI